MDAVYVQQLELVGLFAYLLEHLEQSCEPVVQLLVWLLCPDVLCQQPNCVTFHKLLSQMVLIVPASL